MLLEYDLCLDRCYLSGWPVILMKGLWDLNANHVILQPRREISTDIRVVKAAKGKRYQMPFEKRI